MDNTSKPKTFGDLDFNILAACGLSFPKNILVNEENNNVILSKEESEDDDISEEELFHCNVSFEELDDNEINKIEKRMYPGKYSVLGFLQPGEILMNVYKNDKIFLDKINITYKQMYYKLRTIVGKYYRSLKLGKECLIEGKFTVSSICYNGAQICPFQNKKKMKIIMDTNMVIKI